MRVSSSTYGSRGDVETGVMSAGGCYDRACCGDRRRRSSHPIAEVEMSEEPELTIRRGALGIHSLSRMEDRAPVRRCDIL